MLASLGTLVICNVDGVTEGDGLLAFGMTAGGFSTTTEMRNIIKSLWRLVLRKKCLTFASFWTFSTNTIFPVFSWNTLQCVESLTATFARNLTGFFDSVVNTLHSPRRYLKLPEPLVVF